jgi:hypothetical protein
MLTNYDYIYLSSKNLEGTVKVFRSNRFKSPSFHKTKQEKKLTKLSIYFLPLGTINFSSFHSLEPIGSWE